MRCGHPSELSNTHCRLLLSRHRLDAHHLSKPSHHFAFLGVTSLGFFAINQFVTRQHLKAPPAGRDKREAFDDRCKILKHIGCRTDSTGGVVSLYAVFNAYSVLLHRVSPCWWWHTHPEDRYIGFGIKSIATTDYSPFIYRYATMNFIARLGTWSSIHSFGERWFYLSPILTGDIVCLC